jgi:NAD(P)-dependent dehydrogenase (short-subunit alcohol dehydrogenase family)
MGNLLKGRNAVVTGSSMGIGKAVALALAEEGAKVVVNSSGSGPKGPGTNLQPLNDVVAEIKAKGGVAIASAGSVGDFAYAEKLVKTCVENFGSIDIVANCAGNLKDRMMINMSEEEWDSVVDVHLKGHFAMIRHAAPYMREKRWGRIINFTSNGWLGNVGQINYSASKGGIVSMTYTSALELGSRGITVNCIAPGAKTRMTVNDKVEAGIKKKFEAGLLSKSDFEKFMAMPGPEYVAPMVVYLCTEQAKDINGQVFGAAGGMITYFSKPQVINTLIKSDGVWTVDELIGIVPGTIAKGLVNPSPRKDD